MFEINEEPSELFYIVGYYDSTFAGHSFWYYMSVGMYTTDKKRAKRIKQIDIDSIVKFIKIKHFSKPIVMEPVND